MAKGIASGMPLGVCMSKAEVMDWVPDRMLPTFGGNPVSLAAALATIDILEREGIGNAAKVGAKMLERLNGWKKTHPLVGDVRGRGLMIGVELVKDKGTREPVTELRNRVEAVAFEQGPDYSWVRRNFDSAVSSADCERGGGDGGTGHPGRSVDPSREGVCGNAGNGRSQRVRDSDETRRPERVLRPSGLFGNAGTGVCLRYFAEQGLLRSGRAPAAFASASLMYLPAFVVP